MFSIGEKVFYPNHGGAIVSGVEEREVQGQTRNYYVLQFALENISIMVPIDNCEATGMRKLCTEPEMQAAIKILSQDSAITDKNWSRRYRANEQKIKSGSLNSIAEVVRDLTRADRLKKLSPGENKIYENACNIFLSEIMLLRGTTIEDAENFMKDLIV